ncbi:SDR family oxidoreductase [Rhodococcus jostii]|uniref:SDR family oxidoreductase n=1 Tax=Rhodococcus jostii TaxID=132919 RepID=A0ABU4CTC0_RHOJO|nr:SDR family oxidoreductase [Rhodococcus jostii]MDV6286478.1 SDR family oxidoreductase [Rhodococcus jostii]
MTGGGSGIGLATASRFAVEGASVYIVGRDESKLTQACQQLLDSRGVKVTPLTGDISDPASMAAAAAVVNDRETGVDVVINNAGLASPSTPADDDDFITDLRDRLSIDVIGTAVTTAAFVPFLRRGGSVLNMGSVYATTAAAGTASYSAAKSAIIGLTRTLAVELGPRGIRVNCVSPGWVDVPKWDDYFDEPTLRHLRGDFTRVPLRAAVTADEIAALYAFLAHEDAAAISGQDIVVDRGMSADLYVAQTVPGLA